MLKQHGSGNHISVLSPQSITILAHVCYYGYTCFVHFRLNKHYVNMLCNCYVMLNMGVRCSLVTMTSTLFFSTIKQIDLGRSGHYLREQGVRSWVRLRPWRAASDRAACPSSSSPLPMPLTSSATPLSSRQVSYCGKNAKKSFSLIRLMTYLCIDY